MAFHPARNVPGAGRTRDELVVGSLELLPADGKHVLRPHAEQLLPRVAEQPARGLVDVDEAHRRPVDEHDHVSRVVHREAKTPQLLLRGAALGDVAHPRDDDVAAFRLNGAAEGLDRKPRAVLAPVPACHGAVAPAALDQAVVDPRELLAGDGDDVLRSHREQLLAAIPELPARGVVDVDDLHADRVEEPYHFFGRVHGGPEAAQLLFVLLALQELADLAADHADRLHQPVFGLADFAAVEGEHADRASFRYDREDERSAHSDAAGEPDLTDPGVLSDVACPERL